MASAPGRLPFLPPDASAAEALEILRSTGWREIGRGDWSWVFADADAADANNRIAVRVTPWDPAYALHARLCVQHPDSPYLQRVYRIDPLREVGSAIWMERLHPADEQQAIAFCHALGFGSATNPEWLSRDVPPWPPDHQLVRLRALLQAEMELGQRTLPLWGGSDVSPKNVLADARGQLKIIDPFFVSGRAIVNALNERRGDLLNGYTRAELLAFLQIPVFADGAERDALERIVRELMDP